MRTILNPRVTQIGQTALNIETITEWLDNQGFKMASLEDSMDDEILTELAGRICYMSFPKPRPGGNEAYIQHIKESGHGSVFEHTNWTFIVEDVSLNLTHELVRHRAGMAFSQLSGRYVDRGDQNTGFVMPDLLQKIQASYHPNKEYMIRPWIVQCENQIAAYNNLRDAMMEFLEWAQEHDPLYAKFKNVAKTDKLKMVRGAARSVLGGCVETKIVVTCNTRALRHILEMRASEAADAEICKMGMLMYGHVADSNHFNDYVVSESDMGRQFLTTPYEKV